MSAGGGFPKWVMLEAYLFRRDDDESFPDNTKAPIRASGTTTWGADFRIAFSLAEPPQISRLYAQMPGFPGPQKEEPLAMLATHRHLALLVVFTMNPSKGLLRNFFVFRANKHKPCSSSLTVLPPCTLPPFDYSRGSDGRLPRPSSPSRHYPDPSCPLDLPSLGLWCGGGDIKEEEEFVVAELAPYVLTIGRSRHIKAFADIRLLRASTTKWEALRVPIMPTTNDDLRKLSCWHTDAVVPFQQWLCWVDNLQGILFCDVSNKDKVHVSFLWFPPDLDPGTEEEENRCNSYYRGVSVVDHGRLLKFVNVQRHDSLDDYAALEPGTGFTISCHTLVLGGGGGSMEWKKDDYTVTSDELPGYLQRLRGVPIYPQVDIERPHAVHFLYIEFGKAYEKMSLLSIDMSTKSLMYFDLYMDGNEYLHSGNKDCIIQGLDPDFVTTKSLSPSPTPFLPCEFPRFCRLSRKRKHRD